MFYFSPPKKHQTSININKDWTTGAYERTTRELKQFYDKKEIKINIAHLKMKAQILLSLLD